VSRALAKAAGTLLLAGALAACGRTVAPPPIATVVLEPAAAVRALVERERATETLTAFFRVTLQKPDGSKESSRGALVLRRPDALRLQIFSLGVLTAYDFTAVGDRYRVRLPLEGTTASGRFGESGGREDLLRYDLRPLFLGRERLGAGEARASGDRIRVEVETADGWRRAEIDARSGALVAEEWGRGDRTTLRASYADPRLVDGEPLPHRIRVEWIPTRVSLAIEVTEYGRNRPIRDGTFAIGEDS
jgi:hypothetical protein